MQKPQIPVNESERLEDLNAYGILDTASEKVFNELVSLAAAICGTRYAGISFIASGRQWFKASHGAEMPDSTRDLSVCAHAILETDVFEVGNLPSDDRFIGNPILNGRPRFRFYAGSQLNSDRGNAIGMLCVLDSEPGALTATQREALKQLSHVIMTILDSRRHDRCASWAAFIEGNRQPVFIKDAGSMRYLAANAAGLQHAGCTLEQLLSNTEQIEPEGDPGRFGDYLLRLREGQPTVTFSVSRQREADLQTSFNVTWYLMSNDTSPVIMSFLQSRPQLDVSAHANPEPFDKK